MQFRLSLDAEHGFIQAQSIPAGPDGTCGPAPKHWPLGPSTGSVREGVEGILL